jgi:hypothetical protein
MLGQYSVHFGPRESYAEDGMKSRIIRELTDNERAVRRFLSIVYKNRANDLFVAHTCFGWYVFSPDRSAEIM